MINMLIIKLLQVMDTTERSHVSSHLCHTCHSYLYIKLKKEIIPGGDRILFLLDFIKLFNYQNNRIN